MKPAHILATMLVASLAAPLTAADPAPAGRNASERKVCRVFQEVGSLVRRKRVCKTVAEWDADRALLRQQVGVNSCARQPCEPPGR